MNIFHLNSGVLILYYIESHWSYAHVDHLTEKYNYITVYAVYLANNKFGNLLGHNAHYLIGRHFSLANRAILSVHCFMTHKTRDYK